MNELKTDGLRISGVDGEQRVPQGSYLCPALLHFSLEFVKPFVLPGFKVVKSLVLSGFKVVKPFIQLVPREHQDGDEHAGPCSQSASNSSQDAKHGGESTALGNGEILPPSCPRLTHQPVFQQSDEPFNIPCMGWCCQHQRHVLCPGGPVKTTAATGSIKRSGLSARALSPIFPGNLDKPLWSY